MKKRTLAVLMIMTVISAMIFTACGKKAVTLESYINDHADVKADIEEKLGSEDMQGITVDFKGDEMIYSFDISGMDNMTEDLAKSDEVKEALDAGLEQQSATFSDLAANVLKTLQDDGADIKSVKVTVNYMYGDTLITSRTFEPSAAAADADAPAEEESKDEAAEAEEGEGE